MSKILNILLRQMTSHLPEDQKPWVEDLQAEARHISNGIRRGMFLWGGLQAVFGEIIRIHIGPRRMGQALLCFALFMLCAGGLLFAGGIENSSVKLTFRSLLVLYAIAGGLCAFALDLMKRFVLICAFGLALVWGYLSVGVAESATLPTVFLKAFSIEQAAVMIALYIVASYLTWVESASRA